MGKARSPIPKYEGLSFRQALGKAHIWNKQVSFFRSFKKGDCAFFKRLLTDGGSQALYRKMQCLWTKALIGEAYYDGTHNEKRIGTHYIFIPKAENRK